MNTVSEILTLEIIFGIENLDLGWSLLGRSYHLPMICEMKDQGLCLGFGIWVYGLHSWMFSVELVWHVYSRRIDPMLTKHIGFLFWSSLFSCFWVCNQQFGPVILRLQEKASLVMHSIPSFVINLQLWQRGLYHFLAVTDHIWLYQSFFQFGQETIFPFSRSAQQTHVGQSGLTVLFIIL